MLTAGVHKDATTHLNYARGRLLQGTVRYAQVDAIYYLSRIRLAITRDSSNTQKAENACDKCANQR